MRYLPILFAVLAFLTGFVNAYVSATLPAFPSKLTFSFKLDQGQLRCVLIYLEAPSYCNARKTMKYLTSSAQ